MPKSGQQLIQTTIKEGAKGESEEEYLDDEFDIGEVKQKQEEAKQKQEDMVEKELLNVLNEGLLEGDPAILACSNSRNNQTRDDSLPKVGSSNIFEKSPPRS